MNAISRSTPARTCTGSRAVQSSSSKYPVTGRPIPRVPSLREDVGVPRLLQHQPRLDEPLATVFRDSQLPRELLSDPPGPGLPREPQLDWNLHLPHEMSECCFQLTF